MKIIDALYEKFEVIHAMENDSLKKYSIGFIGLIVTLISFIGWNYYQTINMYKKKLTIVNDIRQNVQSIREQLLYVRTQRTTINGMLKEELDFKLGGYFAKILAKLSLTQNKKTEEISQVDREDTYRESELITTLTGINMKQLTELLYEIEQKKRIYIKKLEISISKKNAETLDILLVIATLLKKENE